MNGYAPVSNGYWDAGVIWETRLKTPGTALPATVDYIRDQVLRAVNPAGLEDEHIRRLILAATAYYEHWTDKALMPQTYEMILNRFPPSLIRLERPPLISVTSVEYFDEAGAAQTLDGADYLVKPSGVYRKAELWPLSGGAWPLTQGARPDAVTITYQCGVPDVTVAPQMEREIEGIALLVSEWYTHRLFMLPGSFTTTQVAGAVSRSGLRLDAFWTKAW